MKAAIFISFLVFSLTGCSTFSAMDSKAHIEHDTCMYMLLDAGQVGNSCNWSSDSISGKMHIAMIKPNLCHVIISDIHNHASNRIEACYQGNNWKFYDR